MPVKVQCPNPACGKFSGLAEDHIGLAVHCPHCRTPFIVPGSSPASPPPADPPRPILSPGPDQGDPGPPRIGRFQIRAHLGSGAFGSVYRAYDPHLDREVALKVPQEGTLNSPALVQRFLREAKLAASLHHAHIVPVYDAGSDGRCHYIASPIIEGRTLAEVLEEGPLDWRRAAQIVRDLAEALAYAHDRGVVHRDFKPANVMVDHKGHVQLMDFGLAYRPDGQTRLTQLGVVLGTPGYMAPEQARAQAEEALPASDQYSLGVVLYELLCGQKPFAGPVDIVLFNTLHQAPPPPRTLQPQVPAALQAICLKALAKRPQDRYAHCGEMAAELQRCLEQERDRAASSSPAIKPAKVKDLPKPAEMFRLDLPYSPHRPERAPMRTWTLALLGSGAAVVVVLLALVLLGKDSGSSRPDRKTATASGRSKDQPPRHDRAKDRTWPTHPAPEKKPGAGEDKAARPFKTPRPSQDDNPNKGREPEKVKSEVKDSNPSPNKPPRKKPSKPASQPGVEYFPRRALAISVNNYLVAGPLAYGEAKASTGAVLNALNRYLHFPNTQLVELSDGTIPARAHRPLKSVIERTLTDFLAASRPMDRVIVLFTGHAVELDRAVYLVPIEGDCNDAKTLIPLSWVYDRLVKSPARQKVLILDVCRLDPARGQERQSTGAMTEAMDAVLRKPPPGIQVWTSCVATQQSYDLFQGSLFLEALATVLKDKAVKGLQDPTDPLPLEVLQSTVAGFIAMHMQGRKFKQTPRLAGKDPNKGAPYDPDVELPPPQVIQPPSGLADGAASKADIQGILDEIESIPPAKRVQGPVERLHMEVLPPFSAKVMAKYKADYRSLQELDERLKAEPKKFPLIRAVRNATLALEKNAQAFTQVQAGRVLPVPAVEKTRIINYQADVVGPVIARLEDALKDLKKAGEDRDKTQAKRWQANYDYVLVKLTNRVIYVREYSLMLGQVRKDELPVPGDRGWRLISTPKLQSTDKEIKDLSREVKEALKRLKNHHSGTPWEVLARRESASNLGLEWRPISKETAKPGPMESPDATAREEKASPPVEADQESRRQAPKTDEERAAAKLKLVADLVDKGQEALARHREAQAGRTLERAETRLRQIIKQSPKTKASRKAKALLKKVKALQEKMLEGK